MRFHETRIAGAFLIEAERRWDERGYFARLFCDSELVDKGLCASLRQVNTGFSPATGTLRGLHFQRLPHAEVKIVRCVRGSVYDVIVDLRPDSPTFKRWSGFELTAENGQMLYAPAGTAHGYLTLAPETELIYGTSCPYSPAAAFGVRYDDPAFGIDWPTSPSIVSVADQSWPVFHEGALRPAPG